MPCLTIDDSDSETEFNPYPDQYNSHHIVDFVPQRYEIKHQINIDDEEQPRLVRNRRVVRNRPIERKDRAEEKAPRVEYSANAAQRVQDLLQRRAVNEPLISIAAAAEELMHVIDANMNPAPNPEDQYSDMQSNYDEDDELPELDPSFEHNPDSNIDEHREEDRREEDQHSNVDEIDRLASQAVYIPPNMHELIRTAVLHILVELGRMPTVPVVRQSQLLPVREITDEMIERVIVEITNG